MKIKKTDKDFAKISTPSDKYIYECKCQYFNIGRIGHKKILAGSKMHCKKCNTYITAIESSIPK